MDAIAPATNQELVDDPRFIRGVALFNEGHYLDASDVFEELFFEGVRDEPDFVRVFLQFSGGIYHAECGQWRPAVERIDEGLRLAATIQNDRMIDLAELAAGMKTGATAVRENRRPWWPAIRRRDA